MSGEGIAVELPAMDRYNFDASLAKNPSSDAQRNCRPIITAPAAVRADFKPSPSVAVTGGRPLSFVGSPSRFTEGRINQPYPDHTQDHAGDSRKAHDVGPERGSLLRYQIIILAALFAGLILLFSFCIRQAPGLLAAGQDQTGLLSLFVGVTGMFLSAIFGGLLVTDLFRAAIYAAAGG